MIKKKKRKKINRRRTILRIKKENVTMTYEERKKVSKMTNILGKN